MIAKIEIPQDLAGSFKRIARRIPVDLRKDEELIKTIVSYLQLGGEKLARQAVEAAKQTLALEVAQRKKKAREEALIRAAEARLAAAEAESAEDEDRDKDDRDKDDRDEDDRDEDDRDEDDHDEKDRDENDDDENDDDDGNDDQIKDL